jgi:hypothetical protein
MVHGKNEREREREIMGTYINTKKILTFRIKNIQTHIQVTMMTPKRLVLMMIEVPMEGEWRTLPL